MTAPVTPQGPHIIITMARSQTSHRNARRLAYLLVVPIIMIILLIGFGLPPLHLDRLALQLVRTLSLKPVSGWVGQHTWVSPDLIAVIQIIALLASIPLINFIYSKTDQAVDQWRSTRLRVIRIQHLELFIPNQLAAVLRLILRYTRILLLVLVVITTLVLAFSLLPITAGVADAVHIKLVESLSRITDTILSFLPNLFVSIIIILITKLGLRLLRFVYLGLRSGKIRFHGFHFDLLEPTYQLLRFLVIALALVAIFPYIPGSSSPVFKGISIFVGFLVSMGSTSLVANIVAGIVITYTRGLKLGDRVQIGDTIGDVVERTSLVTRVRTIKNVVVSIPNAKVLQHEIINYSAEARERGLILHTSITIGYDVPWRQVQHLMISAALETTYILKSPPPFVLKTNLDDSYISYELNAYTNMPVRMVEIYSELHQNILDQFNQAGVEIMSPSYLAFRDGKASTIPPIDHPDNGDNNGGHPRASFTQRTNKLSYRLHTRPR
jgi:small-conductance mechanosensitive channel